MVREFLEIDDLETFRRVAEQSPLVIRRDPFLFAQYFAVMFFVNLAEMERGEVKRLFEMLKGKTIEGYRRGFNPLRVLEEEGGVRRRLPSEKANLRLLKPPRLCQACSLR